MQRSMCWTITEDGVMKEHGITEDGAIDYGINSLTDPSRTSGRTASSTIATTGPWRKVEIPSYPVAS